MSYFVSKIGHLDPRFYSLIYCAIPGVQMSGVQMFDFIVGNSWSIISDSRLSSRLILIPWYAGQLTSACSSDSMICSELNGSCSSILSLSLASPEQQYLQDLSTSVGETVLEAYRPLSMFKSCALDLIQAIFFLAW